MARITEFPAPNGGERQALLEELDQVRQEIAALDLEEPEDAAALCAKTHAAADRWEPVAQRLWEEGHWTSGPNAGRRK